MKIKSYCLIIFLLLCQFEIYAQDRFELLQEKLEKLTVEIPALNERINISVTKVSIQEFLRGVANNSGLNIDVDPTLNITVVNNFSNVTVRDILVYLCRQNDLELRIIGNIVNVYKPISNEPIKTKPSSVKYDSSKNEISFDYNNENIQNAVKEIALISSKNIVLSPGLLDMKVNGFIINMPFESALEKFMYANNLLVRKTEDDYFVVEPKPAESKENISNKRRNSQKSNSSENSGGDENSSLEVNLLSKDSVKVDAEDVSIVEILMEVASKTKSNYYISGKIEDKATFKIDKASFKDVLGYLLNGSKFTFKQYDSIFVIGGETANLLKESSVLKLKNRTIDKLSEVIPKSLKENLEIIEFPDLNSLLVSGPQSNVKDLVEFVYKIDQVVPVILIEVIIVDISNKFTLSTGIKAALGENKEATKGTVFPGVDMTFGSDAINKFLKNSSVPGIEKLGNVTPNFYIKLSALEEQGLLNIRSTPQLSTLNGHEATLSIGNTEYYLEEQSNLIGTQNPVSTSMKVYKSLNAELAITIKPFVAGDDQVTLDIEVKQSDFTTRISPTAPPGTISRNFKSQVRIKNQEMVLLGGLEEKRVSDSGSGFPILSRIPIIKWFFSSREKKDTKSKLNIFIRPTIVS